MAAINYMTPAVVPGFSAPLTMDDMRRSHEVYNSLPHIGTRYKEEINRDAVHGLLEIILRHGRSHLVGGLPCGQLFVRLSSSYSTNLPLGTHDDPRLPTSRANKRLPEPTDNMTSINPTRQELESINKRLSESMREVRKEEEDLSSMMAYIETMSAEQQQMMIDMSSSSRKRRDMDEAKSGRGYLNTLRQEAARKRDAIGRLWLKINELQTREAELKAKGE
ncbi:hypothetical protein AK830_g7445 [Neonectria ditissima]|uniref:Uncharacterized protein n=1 Tax=Neonectria ditissima TaxID=78410 RepID=A0A0P7BEV4_9HYPO|nr:hypothetical protein AK830_g7445 [Neonectria ditissima]